MKYLLLTLIVQDGENRHDHKILHTTNCKDIKIAAEWYASHFYGDNSELRDNWWEFNAGCIAVEMYSVVELTEFEYKIMSKFFDGDIVRKDYFTIVHTGYQHDLQREEIQIHAGENGNIYLIKTPEGIIVDVYGQNDLVDTLSIFEDEFDPKDPDEKNEPTKEEIKAYLKEWGQKQGEITSNLGYPASHSESDELLMEDYFFLEGKKQWYPKISRMYSEREQIIADYVRNNRDNY